MVLEWIGAHLLGPIINLYRAIASRPRPDLRILELVPAGGADGLVDFSAELANYGSQQCRCEMTAHVGDQAVECRPSRLDLAPNTAPQVVRVIVPRPQLGDLVPQFNNDTTLYDKTLRVEAVAGKHRAVLEWHEVTYSQEENWQRYNVQQRVWRRGVGRDTPEDQRQEYQGSARGAREFDRAAGPPLTFHCTARALAFRLVRMAPALPANELVHRAARWLRRPY